VIDLGISKMALIGAVALIVIGPEKLPRVARTVGTLLGKAQRYVADVKNEVNRSMELDELKKMKETVEGAARDVENSIQTNASDFEKSWAEATGDSSSSSSLARHGNFPRVQAPEKEVAAQAGRDAPVVQGPFRRAHPGAVRRGPRGAFPSAAGPHALSCFPADSFLFACLPAQPHQRKFPS
jgi:sec-independent protein translocase protein TatB